MTLPAADDLRELLGLLSLKRQYVVSIEALQVIQKQARDKPLPEAFFETINDLRRVVYRHRDYEQTGLFEFHLGLLFFEGERYLEAIELFERAKRQWILFDSIILICLADFSKAVMYHNAYRYEEALTCYLEVQQCIENRDRDSLRQPEAGRVVDYQIFVNRLRRHLGTATPELRDSMRGAHRARLLPLIAVKPPLIKDDLMSGSPSTKLLEQCTISFDYDGSLKVVDFHKTILPIIERVERVNRTLAGLCQIDPTPTLLIRDIKVSKRLEITLGELLPETMSMCKRLINDQVFVEDVAKTYADLEKVRSEISNFQPLDQDSDKKIGQQASSALVAKSGQLRQKINRLLLNKCRELVDCLSPDNATDDQLSVATYAILTSVQFLLESLTGKRVTVLEGSDK